MFTYKYLSLPAPVQAAASPPCRNGPGPRARTRTGRQDEGRAHTGARHLRRPDPAKIISWPFPSGENPERAGGREGRGAAGEPLLERIVGRVNPREEFFASRGIAGKTREKAGRVLICRRKAKRKLSVRRVKRLGYAN